MVNRCSKWGSGHPAWPPKVVYSIVFMFLYVVFRGTGLDSEQRAPFIIAAGGGWVDGQAIGRAEQIGPCKRGFLTTLLEPIWLPRAVDFYPAEGSLFSFVFPWMMFFYGLIQLQQIVNHHLNKVTII